MTPAAQSLAPILRELRIGTPGIPVVANVTGAEVADPEAIRDCLIRQVNHPVRWMDCMRTMLDAGVKEFVEVGPGRVLAGLMKRIDSSAKVTSLSTPEEIEQLQL
jgi:[acyl-carrier-protein] S-malonyltransferase